jgi:hypothetical protein
MSPIHVLNLFLSATRLLLKNQCTVDKYDLEAGVDFKKELEFNLA